MIARVELELPHACSWRVAKADVVYGCSYCTVCGRWLCCQDGPEGTNDPSLRAVRPEHPPGFGPYPGRPVLTGQARPAAIPDPT